MLIKRITVGEIKVPLKVPFKTAVRSVNEMHALVVQIETSSGLIGYGEAPATARITGDLIDSMRAGLDLLAPRLLGKDVMRFNALLRTLHGALVHHTSLKAALEIALYDLRAQRLGLPLYQLLGGGDAQLKTDITISVNSVDEMVKEALDGVAKGFDCLKIKVGGHTWRDDVDSVLAIERAVGPRVTLRLDANQGWTAKHAVLVIQALEKAGVALELVEQPVPADDLAGLKMVTDLTLTPIMADEAVFSSRDALRVFCSQSADIVNIKLMKSAGISQAIEIASLARLHHKTCMIGCMLEGAIGATAAAHFAVAFEDVVTYVDLDGPQLCAYTGVEGGMIMNGPWIELSDAPGLGITAVNGMTNVKVFDV